MASHRRALKGQRPPAGVNPANLITIQEAALAYNVTDRTIRNWVYRGLLTLWEVGPRLKRIDRVELHQLARPVSGKGVA
ncbi:excisionase family DNA-binding protein [Nocardia sp. NPDC004711]